MATNNLFGFMLLILMNHSLLFPSSFALWLTASLLRVKSGSAGMVSRYFKVSFKFQGSDHDGREFPDSSPLT
jgi:hypothetical protein